MHEDSKKMEKVVALCKRRGFVFQGSDIYGGLRGMWDLGPLGVMLSNNIKREWRRMFIEDRSDMYEIDAAIIMNARVWEASGHTGAGFSDPMVEDLETGDRFRADHLLKDNGINADGLTLAEINEIIREKGIRSPKGNLLSEARHFNLMFKTQVGATSGDEGLVYLRPETAGGIFVNFKNVVDTMSPKMPFGIAQIGKAYRNEISPRDFLFRVREFEQMEIEYFIRPTEWEIHYEALRKNIHEWFAHIGLSPENIREYEVPENDLAHYSKRTIDFEYNYPGKGFDEIVGFAYRTDFDLSNHSKHSGVSLAYTDADGSRFIPHVVEPSFGVGRAFVAILTEAYREDEMNDEKRVYLKLPTHLAPYRVAVSPLLKNKPELVAKAREIYAMLKKRFGNVAWDDHGNIGKRYRRQDEIGTPYCVTVDFGTLGENGAEEAGTVTVRDRDTGIQKRVAIDALIDVLN